MINSIIEAFNVITLAIGFPFWVLLIVTSVAGAVLGILLGLRYRKNAVIVIVGVIVVGVAISTILYFGSVVSFVHFIVLMISVLVFPLALYISIVISAFYGKRIYQNCDMANSDRLVCKIVGVDSKKQNP
jgi:hypothetical protein